MSFWTEKTEYLVFPEDKIKNMPRIMIPGLEETLIIPPTINGKNVLDLGFFAIHDLCLGWVELRHGSLNNSLVCTKCGDFHLSIPYEVIDHKTFLAYLKTLEKEN
ncbi:MAG: hypothetical protein PHI53_00805 [Candidatus Pacebacteria bacterium]|nr:hypothetical protein [Candidatus Paceibacterota bacterium]